MSTQFSIGQMNQLADALERAGYSSEEVTKLRSDATLLERLKFVFAGNAEIIITRHIIDLDASPFCPDGWRYRSHVQMGQFEWDPAKIATYLSLNQRHGHFFRGDKLHRELRDKPVFNANLLDYLLKYPDLIPKDWEDRMVVFWGTIYCHWADRNEFAVRCLVRGETLWRWEFRNVDSFMFDENHPATVLVT